ncbi:MAG: DUF421 domain-containing protein [Chloroflexota bacterium]|nr:DUF421 domain-containing protein [Chloroflexota bacterium]
MSLWPQEWHGVLLPDQAIVESIVRISLVYLCLFGLLRVVLKRESSGADISDMLMVVLLADAVQNGMSGHYSSIGTALIIGTTLILWDWVLSWLDYHGPFMARLMHRGPLLIVKDGRILTNNARRELLTRSDIEEKVRMQGVPSLTIVKRAYLEDNGKISVITEDAGEEPWRDEQQGG